MVKEAWPKTRDVPVEASCWLRLEGGKGGEEVGGQEEGRPYMLAGASLPLARYRLLASEPQKTELTAHDTISLPIAVREGSLLRFWC